MLKNLVLILILLFSSPVKSDTFCDVYADILSFAYEQKINKRDINETKAIVFSAYIPFKLPIEFFLSINTAIDAIYLSERNIFKELALSCYFVFEEEKDV